MGRLSEEGMGLNEKGLKMIEYFITSIFIFAAVTQSDSLTRF